MSSMGKKNSLCQRLGFLAVVLALLIITGIITPLEAKALTIFSFGPPKAPGNLKAIAVSSTRIDLWWQDNSSNEINFVIERRSGRSAYVKINSVGSNVTNISDFYVKPNTTYYYRIMAHGSAGDSAYSNEAYATTLAPPIQAPVLTVPGYSALVSTLTPRMRWTSAEINVTYTIQIATDYDFNSIVLEKSDITTQYYDVPASVLSYKFSSYYWRVSAQNSAGASSPWSYRWYFRALPQPFDRQNSCGCG